MISLSCFAHFLWEWDDLCCRGRVPLDASHLVHGLDERPEPTIELKVVLTRLQFFFLNRHSGVVSEGHESRSQAIDLVPKLVGYLGWNRKFNGLRQVVIPARRSLLTVCQ
jgi:hypothetical protein